jgi:hypothetical protein
MVAVRRGISSLSGPHGRDYAIRDFKSHLKKSCKAKPASVNLTLAALDNLYLFLGLGRANVRREDLPQEAPRALEPEEQKRFMRAVERAIPPVGIRSTSVTYCTVIVGHDKGIFLPIASETASIAS